MSTTDVLDVKSLEHQIQEMLNKPVSFAQGLSDDIYNHYSIIEENIKAQADELENQAAYLRRVAEAVAQRREHLRSEMSAANDFEHDTVSRIHKIRELITQINGVFITNESRKQ